MTIGNRALTATAAGVASAVVAGVLLVAGCTATPPPTDALRPLPDGVRLDSETTECTKTSWDWCTRTITLTADEPASALKKRVIEHYRHARSELHEVGSIDDTEWRACEGFGPGNCLTVSVGGKDSVVVALTYGGPS